MKVLSIINLKGGVGKTISSANIGYILSELHNYKVLLIDNDKQGNLSKIFNRHNYELPGVEEIMTNRNVDVFDLIQNTEYKNLDIISANMKLLTANLEVMLDQVRPQQTRIKQSIKQVEQYYDYCIIDNAPDINISTINALDSFKWSNDTYKIDEFAFWWTFKELVDQINNTKVDLNENLVFRGCFVTSYVNNEVNRQGKEWLKESNYKVFDSHIRRTEKIDESTFAKMPINLYSKRCGAAVDYKRLVEEYLSEYLFK